MFSNLQILRAVDALSVVLYHIRGTAESYNYNPKIVSLLGNLGSSGVDIFFVISGFIMLHTQFDNKQTVLNFFKKKGHTNCSTLLACDHYCYFNLHSVSEYF